MNWDYLQLAGLALWLAGSLFFLLQLGIFTPKGLKDAPSRQSTLSLPIVGMVIVLYLGVQTVCVLLAIQLGALTWDDLSHAENVGPEKEVVFNILGMLVFGLTLIPVLVAVPWLFKDGFRGLGLHPRQLAGGAARGGGGFFIWFPIWFLIALGVQWVYNMFNYHMTDHETIRALAAHPALWRQLMLCFAAIVVAPVTEEIFFRGIFQTALVQYGFGFFVPQLMRKESLPLAYRPPPWQRCGAIVVASIVFAFQHQADQRPLIFALAVGLGYVYERTGNLWASITFHMLFNLTSIATLLAG